MAAVPCVLERQAANDEAATVVAIHAADGDRVKEGDPVVDVETSKATEEVGAPAEGIVRHALTIGDTIAYGLALFSIEPEGDAERSEPQAPPAAPEPAAETAAEPAAPTPFRRLSPRAAALVRQEGVDPERLPGGLVTLHDVRALLRGERPAAPPPVAPAAAAAVPAAAPDGERRTLAPRKHSEIGALTGGAAAAGTLSVVGHRIGRLRRRADAAGFFDGRILDLVVYEASRLMRRYPDLNACFLDDGSVVRHAAVNAGVALDDGGRLAVAAVPDSDTIGLPEIQDAILELVEAYAGDRLSRGQVTSATFTVTDLSQQDASFILPLLPRGQSAIVGIGREADEYRLFLGFDHRVSEGRAAASFLAELGGRLRSFDVGEAADAAECGICGKTLADELDQGGRGLVRVLGRSGREDWICGACFGGW